MTSLDALLTHPKSKGVTERPLTESEVHAVAESWYDDLVDLLRSEMGWQTISGFGLTSDTSLDEPERARDYYVKQSRLLARREPLSKQAVRLYTTYSGILKIAFKSSDPKAQKIFESRFWDLRSNRRVLGAMYRRKLATRLLTDGELFLALVSSRNGEVRIRMVDPLQITEVITHPEDSEVPLYYKRVVPATNVKKTPKSKAGKTLLYKDYSATKDDLADAKAVGFDLEGEVRGSSSEIAKDGAGNEILMFHVPFDATGLRGNGLLFPVLSYIEAFRGFLQDRATIVRGLSTYIRTITVKGGSKAVNDMASRFRSALASGDFFDTNPPDAVGSTWVQNANATKQDTPPVTNAGEAMSDSRILRQPVAAGVGITEANLMGDPSIGNLASQTQMEGPQLHNFEDFQMLLEEMLIELWRYVLMVNGYKDWDSVDLDVDFPAIIHEPLQVETSTILQGLQASLIPFEEASRRFLVALGSTEVDKLVAQAKEEKSKAGSQGPPPGMGSAKTPSPNEEAPRVEAELSEVYRHKNHGRPIPGECPFCGTKHLLEEHGLRYCTLCDVTFNPEMYPESLTRQGQIEEVASVLESLLLRVDDLEESYGGRTNGRRKT